MNSDTTLLRYGVPITIEVAKSIVTVDLDVAASPTYVADVRAGEFPEFAHKYDLITTEHPPASVLVNPDGSTNAQFFKSVKALLAPRGALVIDPPPSALALMGANVPDRRTSDGRAAWEAARTIAIQKFGAEVAQEYGLQYRVTTAGLVALFRKARKNTMQLK